MNGKHNSQSGIMSPLVLSHQPIRFETAQSWNKGHGNLKHPGTGNNGVNYPREPYPGEHTNGNTNSNGGVGNSNGNGNAH
ncbi:hypothetical protein J7E71_21235 [Mesobacillus foraminis]|uniref:hypothetical protein n=1 Tax=Mesobacillus foraminis TaxID=279826 RepID=UPI001BEAF7C0|nr:hypothetical protein [Mesobacillus foraminis]MBT2758397.1 hypothetical protein [Mesobacillus foraminis]